jgi:hypothetical protein
MSMYVPSEGDDRVVNNDVRHQYRVLTDAEKTIMVRIKDEGALFLAMIDSVIPQGRENSLAKTKIQEAVFWAVHGLTK